MCDVVCELQVSDFLLTKMDEEEEEKCKENFLT